MIHYDRVMQKTIAWAKERIREHKDLEIFIVQNVYGKISLYIDTADDSLIREMNASLEEEIEEWLNGCEKLQDNYFAEKEFEQWKKNHKSVSEGIWAAEKFLTNAYWDSEQVRQEKCELSSKLVSFYSFKGGVGRTTTMVMSAIELAKRGKKIVLIDLDLEAPGIASLFPEDAISQYGVLDFLLESQIYRDDINIDEYVYTVSDYCHVSQDGGDIYIVPALGQICRENAELYRKNLMRLDLNVPAYREETTPFDFLLKKVDSFLHPDYIFIDTRSGLHQIGGITLARYSDMAVLFFYGSHQNAEGMKMVLPVLKNYATPFTLVNCKVPANEGAASEEKKIYLEASYAAMSLCDEQYQKEEVMIDDDTGEHYPLDISYSDTLEVVNNSDQLLKAFEEQRVNYRQLVNVLEDSLLEEQESIEMPQDMDRQQDEIIDVFSDIMSGLQTGAAEDEFSSEESLIENFYPLKGYTFIFDARKFLILGQKGVGKTALFSALKNNEYARSLARYLKINSQQYENTEWIVGTSRETNWASVFACLTSDEQITAFLYYKTIEILLKNDERLKTLLEEDPVREMYEHQPDINFYQGFTNEAVYRLETFLNKINAHLKKQNRIVTIIYDALDRIVSQKHRAKFNSALVTMWYQHESTMQNIRSKIFLRQDIYDREVKVADKVKLKNYSTTLAWEYDQLFAMVWKRALCKSVTFKTFYEKTVSQNVLEAEGLSYIPQVNEEANREMLAALVGVRMGSGKKAFTYNWFRNRLSDTQGVIVPRSMLDIFARAADREKELRISQQASGYKSLIRPRCFEESLQTVSEKRVIDLKEEYVEYADFLDQLKDTVQRSPVEQKQLDAALRKAGFENPGEEIKNLINIGILRKYQRRTSDPERYHFPDIYLRGLGLQRSGMR